MSDPLKFLNDKNNTWEDIASAYFSEGKKNKTRAILAAGFIGWMGGREKAMIKNTNLKLAELERSKTLQHSKLTEQHKNTQETIGKFNNYLSTPDYFNIQAEANLDEGDKDYWTTVGGSLGRDSEYAQLKRKEDIKKVSKELRDNLFAKMGYKTNTKGEYEVDPVTKVPIIYAKDDLTTPDVNEREVRRSEILRKQTLEEAQKPFEDYYVAQQQAYVQPKEISWAAERIDKTKSFLGLSPKDDPSTPDINEAATAIERDAKRLKKSYQDNYIATSKRTDPFLIPTTINGISAWDARGKKERVGIPIYRTTQEAFIQSEGETEVSVGFGKEEFKNRIAATNIDVRIKRNLYEEIDADSDKVKLVSGKEIDRVYTPATLKAKIYQQQVDFNALGEELEDKLELFDSKHFKSVDQRILNSTKDLSEERFSLWMKGLDYKSVKTPNKKETVQFNISNLNTNEQSFYRAYKNERAEFVDEQMGTSNATRENFNKLQELTQYIAINNEAKANNKLEPFSNAELKSIRAEIQDISLGTIEKLAMTMMLEEMGGTQTKLLRQDSFRQNATIPIIMDNPDDPGGDPIEFKAKNEAEYQDKILEEAMWRSEQLIIQFNEALGIE